MLKFVEVNPNPKLKSTKTNLISFFAVDDKNDKFSYFINVREMHYDLY